MIALRSFRNTICRTHQLRPILTSSSRLQPFHVSATTRCDAFAASLQSNQKWADDTAKHEPSFFAESAKGQAPAILWIGCSDSRVPETTVLGLQPGDVFTHRNIANVVNSTDLSLLSVVEFSVKNLKVKHVVLCGHTSCGGVAATLGNKKLDVLDLWLQPMRVLREQHAAELEKLDDKEKGTYLAKLNVKAGVVRLRRMAPVLEAARDRGLQVHGVIYDLATGKVEDLKCSEDDSTSKQRLAAFEME